MHSIRLERLAFAYSDRVPLLADVDLHLTRGFTGIVGENGAGKSTLLALVEGTLAPTRGRVIVQPRAAVVAHCPQELPPDGTSPGERRRRQIGEALARDPDILLLDEPTNHLDAAGRGQLVRLLRRFTGAALVISHDRGLLDDLTTATIRIHATHARLYPGGYTAARAIWEADAQRAQEVRDDARQIAKRATALLVAARTEQRAADRNRSGARKKGPKDHDATTLGRTTVIRWAEDRAGRRVEVARRAADAAIAAIPDVAARRALGRSLFVDYERCPRRWLVELDAPELRAGEAVVLRGVRVAVRPTDRIRIAGGNGAGKTTLVTALLAAQRLPADRLLVLPQELDDATTAAHLARLHALPSTSRGRVLSLVAALGVEPDRLLASQAPSPGESRKLALALGLGSHAWGLVLDEPTNHLDLPSIERLEDALAAYPGALVLVTHDDHVAARCTTATWQVADGRVTAV